MRIKKSERVWRVLDENGAVVYASSMYAKAVGVSDYLWFWRTDCARQHDTSTSINRERNAGKSRNGQ
jgi:hypothetical protein